MLRYLAQLLIVWMCLATTRLQAQQSNAQVAQLTTRLAQAPNDTVRLNVLVELAQIYDGKDADRCLQYAFQAWDLAQQLSNGRQMIEAAETIGTTYFRDLQDFSASLPWMLKVLDISEYNRDSIVLGKTLYNLGGMFAEEGDSVQSRKYFYKAIKVSEARREYNRVAMSNLALGLQDRSHSVRQAYFYKALRALEKDTSLVETRLQAWKYLADDYYKQGNWEIAQQYYRRILSRIAQGDLDLDTPFYNYLLATAYGRTGEYDRAELAAKTIIEGAKARNSANGWYAPAATEILSEIYHLQGKDSLAYLICKQFAYQLDSLRGARAAESARKRVFRLQAEFDSQRRDQQLTLLQTQAHYKNWLASVLALAVLLSAAFAIYFYRSRQREQLQNIRLERLNRTKDKLLSIISHDVRSPINAMENVLHLFGEQFATASDVRTVASQVQASVQNLAQNLDTLFIWAQSQQQELVALPERLDLVRFVNEQLDLLRERAQSKGIAIQSTLPNELPAYVDPVHLRLILQNVLINAFKFTPPQGSISMSHQIIGEQMVALMVTDTGVGLSADAIQKIFDPTIRYTRPGTNGEPGSGLGLQVTQELLVLNHGKIEFKTPPVGGTEVTLYFRLVPPNA